MELKIPPVLVVLIFAVSMLGLPEISSFHWFDVQITRITSLAVFFVGLSVAVLAIVSFRAAKTTVDPLRPDKTSQLVDVGIYKFSRNPMYLGLFLILLSWGIWLGNFLGFINLYGFIWYMTKFQILPEEKVLEGLFPEEFEAYKSKVRRWI